MLILTLQVLGHSIQAIPSSPQGHEHTPPAIMAARIDRSPVLDGRLDDAAWQAPAAITALVQSDPDEGLPASESTEVRLTYDATALYVGVRLFDHDPAAIVQRLGRRDFATPTDEFRLLLDTYHDHRTTFLFAVSPAGVQRDGVAGDDGDDFVYSWDAVWQAATGVDSLGWTVEMRIPFSQLRFSPAQDQTWGVRVVRWIQRKNELALFPFVSKTESGMASRFAHLTGLRDLNAPRRLEVLPYTVA